MSAEGARLATGWLELTVSTKGAQKSIVDQVVPGASAAGDQAGTSLGEQLLGGLKKAAGPIAAIVAGISVGKLVKDSSAAFMDLVGSVNALQRIAGGSKEEVSGLRASLALSGVDADKATTALTIFSKNLGNAAADGASASAMAQKLGVDFLDAAGQVKPMSEILPGLADQFKAMPDGAEKTALAAQLFGRSGAQMIPFLNKGSAGIADLTAKAKDMGLIIDDVSAKSFSAAKVSAREYSMSVQGLMVTLGGGLTPILTAVSNVYRSVMIPVIQATTKFLADHRGAFIAVADGIQGFADRVRAGVSLLVGIFTQGDYSGELGRSLGLTEDSPIIGALFTIRDGVITVFGGIRDTIGQVFAAIAPAFTGLMPVISGLLPTFLQLYTSLSPTSLLFQALLPVLPSLVALLTTLGQAVGGLLSTALTALLPPILTLASTLGGVLTTALTSLVPIIVQLVTSGLNTFVGIITVLLPIVAQLASVLGGVLGQAVASLMPVVAQIVTLLGGVLTQAITTLMPVFAQLLPIVGQIAGVLGGVLGTVIQALVPIITLIATVLGSVLTAAMPLVDVFFQLITPLLGLLTPILSLIAPLLQLVGSILTPLIQLFTSLLTPILSLIAPLVGLLVPVLQFVVSILTFLVQGIVDVITWLVQLATGTGDAGNQIQAAWNFISQVFQVAVGLVVGIVSGFISNTIGMFTDFGNNLAAGAQLIWSNVTGFFRAGVDGIVGFFTGLPDMIIGAISGLGDMIFTAAQGLIQNLIDGFKSMLGPVGDAVGGIMNFVGDFFPHSPAPRGPFSGSGWSGVAASGKALGKQWAGGIVGAKPDVEKYMTELASGVTTPSKFLPQAVGVPRATALNTGAGSGATGFPDSVSFSGNTFGYDPAEVIEAIRREKRNSQMRASMSKVRPA